MTLPPIPVPFRPPGVSALGRLGHGASGVDEGLHVALDHAAVGTGGIDKGQIRAAFFGQSLGAGRNLHFAHEYGGFGFFRNRSGGGSLGGRSGFLSGGSGVAGLGGTERVDAFAGIADDADVGQAGNVVAFVEEDFQHGAGFLGFFVKSGLIGFVGEQDIADSDGITLFLVPLGDDTAFHCIALTGHNDCNCHKFPPVFAHASACT